MAFLRRISTTHLVLLCAGVIAVAAGGTALAVAGSGGPKPPRKALAVAVRDALSGSAPAGVTARISFTNNLVDSAVMHGSNPLISGADGRMWASADGRFRLELQSAGGLDAQIVSDGTSFWIYDGSSNTVYRGELPKSHAAAAAKKETKADKPLTLARIQSVLATLGKRAALSSAKPDNVANERAYSVSLSPRQGGSLLDSVALAWDASRGVPLRFGVYAKGHSGPVLELKATEVSFGAVPNDALSISPPTGAKTIDLMPGTKKADTRDAMAKGSATHPKPVAGLAAVQAAVPFKLAAPRSLAGRPRQEVRLLAGKTGHHPTVTVTYGRDLGAIVVLQQQASATAARSAPEKSGPLGRLELPTVALEGASGQELDTALGTVIRFERAGVAYTVLGSVSPATAQAAAHGL